MFFRSSTPSISVTELQAKMDSAEAPILLDIRSTPEREQMSLGGLHIEMSMLQGRLDELAGHEDTEIVVYCHSGARSAAVVRFLRQQGYPKAINLAGGVVAWARKAR